MNGVEARLPSGGRRFPLVLEPRRAGRGLDDWLSGQLASVEALLLEHGALLLRGFAVADIEDFDAVVASLECERMDYLYGSTPRTAVGRRIFTATEYPAVEEIPLHNECAYQRRWPMKLAFCCLSPAESGGETPLADVKNITDVLGRSLVEEFDERGVRYIRHYHPSFDVPWQQVFSTEDRSEVARACEGIGISHEWLEGNILRTSQCCQGAACHPVTSDRVFFNQAHLFHVSRLGERGARAMRKVFGETRLPRHASFADGGEIPLAHLETIRRRFNDDVFDVQWKAGDVLLIDNMRVAHGRRAFRGPRRLVAALLQPFEPASSQVLQTCDADCDRALH